MKNAVSILLCTLCLFLTVDLSSQVHYNIKAGPNFPYMLFSENFEEVPDDFKMKSTYHVGITIDIQVSKLLSIETGALYSKKGGVYEESELLFDESYNYKLTISTSYIDIPAILRANFKLGKPTTLFVGFGPYMSIGLDGIVNSEFSYDGQIEYDEEEIEWGNDPQLNSLKRFDYGIVPTLGLEIHPVSLSISYWLGLANISAYTENGTSIKNHNFQVSLGFIIGQNRIYE